MPPSRVTGARSPCQSTTFGLNEKFNSLQHSWRHHRQTLKSKKNVNVEINERLDLKFHRLVSGDPVAEAHRARDAAADEESSQAVGERK